MYQAIEEQEREALRRAFGIVYVSEFMRHKVQERQIGIDDVPCAVVPNFITDPGNDVILPHSDLINVGSFEPRKNQGFIRDLLAAARKDGEALNTTLVGDGPTRKETEARADRLGLRDQISFTGYVPEAASRMSGHRAYIHAARVENMPIVLIEAMSKGLPIFAPAVGGIPEVFRDGIEGRYLPLDDPVESAARVVGVLRDRSILSTMGKAARPVLLLHSRQTGWPVDYCNSKPA